MNAPTCPDCDIVARLTNGREIYPHRPDLSEKPIYVCDGCGARVGCHPGTTKPMGTPAGTALRDARHQLHAKRIDPLWQNAWRDEEHAESQKHSKSGRRANGSCARKARKAIVSSARGKVYAFLADQMQIPRDECHTGMFDLARCRAAWRALQGVTYQHIQDWAKARKEAA